MKDRSDGGSLALVLRTRDCEPSFLLPLARELGLVLFERAVEPGSLDYVKKLLPDFVLFVADAGRIEDRVMMAELAAGVAAPAFAVLPNRRQADEVLMLSAGAAACFQDGDSHESVASRIQSLVPLQQVDLGPLRLLPADGKVFVRDRELPLPPTQFRTLLTLARHAGRLVSAETLTATIARPDRDRAGAKKLARVHVMRLRRHLDAAGLRDFITTVRGVGYMVSNDLARP